MDERRQWMPRLICLLLIACLGFAYQSRAQAWQWQTEANQAAIREVETYNASVAAEQERLEAALLAAQEALREREAEEAEADRQRELAEAEALAAAEAASAAQVYVDGEFTASALGFGGEIVLSVSLLGDEIQDINILSHDQEDEIYFAEAMAVVDRILSAQSTDVDTVAGATFSSAGILQAVEQAMEQAREAK